MHTGRPQQPHHTHAWERTPQGRCTSSVRGGLQGNALGSWPGGKNTEDRTHKKMKLCGGCAHTGRTPLPCTAPFLSTLQLRSRVVGGGRGRREGGAGYLGVVVMWREGCGELTRGARGGGTSLAHGVTTARHHRVDVLHTHGHTNTMQGWMGLNRVRMHAR